MEKNSKSEIYEIQIPHNESLESILSLIDGYDIDFYDKRRNGILKIEFSKKES
jgi:hypothetical protein